MKTATTIERLDRLKEIFDTEGFEHKLSDLMDTVKERAWEIDVKKPDELFVINDLWKSLVDAEYKLTVYKNHLRNNY